MCGLSGFNWEDKVLGEKMHRCISHRGPDSDGIYSDQGITLAHRRLAIIDLSAAANQPMYSSDGNLVMIFNGEIYNYKDLKKELVDSYDFKTESDSEVIIAGFKKWGNEIFNKLNGIFALAIWDRSKQTLTCARDHLGIKPFYYYYKDQKFIFGSEIKAIFEHDFPRKLNINSFNEYLRVLYVPEPHTMVQNVFKLPPGSFLTLKSGNIKIENFYAPKLSKSNFAYREAKKAVKEEVINAVERQLVADVPVGVYLSGGIDSSAVLACATRFKPKIKTFSIGFDLDESEERDKFNKDFELARKTAEHFGSTHFPLVISSKDVAESLVETIENIDDPISNPTAIPMAHLSKFAKKEVTVVLSGNGGDELFGGYERYRMSKRVDVVGSLPGVNYLLPQKIRGAYEMNTLDRLVQFEFEKDKRLNKVINKKYFMPVGEIKPNFKKYTEGSNDKTEALMLADLRSWLPDQALALGDRMSMLGSIEERVPLLDKELINLSMKLPISFKVTPFQTKRILKDAFRNDLPEFLFTQPKRGWFSPGAKWLRRPEIEKIAREVLSKNYYKGTEDLFDWKSLETVLNNHLDKSEYNLTLIWMILTFQIWARKYKIIL